MSNSLYSLFYLQLRHYLPPNAKCILESKSSSPPIAMPLTYGTFLCMTKTGNPGVLAVPTSLAAPPTLAAFSEVCSGANECH